MKIDGIEARDIRGKEAEGRRIEMIPRLKAGSLKFKGSNVYELLYQEEKEEEQEEQSDEK